VLIVTEKDPDSFGRYLAWVYAADTGACLNAAVVQAGYATEYEP
jgi:endonuclease YncB( thermonuclease family)